MTYFMALLLTLSALFTGPTEAPTQALSQPIQAPLTAPLTALSYEAPTVTTSPAHEAPIQAPTEAPQVWPIPQGAPFEAHTHEAPPQPTAAPTQPTAAPETPVLTPQGTNPECSEQSMQTADDGTCLIGTECAVQGHTLDVEGNCTAPKENG